MSKPKPAAKTVAQSKAKPGARSKSAVKTSAAAKPKATMKTTVATKGRASSRETEPPKSATNSRSSVEPKTKTAGAVEWRAETLDRMRSLILEAHPEIVEEVKWRKPSNGMTGVPVWSYKGIICTGETYKNAVKLTFARGASLPDPRGLFNSSLEGNQRRAIDIHEGEAVDADAFKALVKAAIALNGRAKSR